MPIRRTRHRLGGSGPRPSGGPGTRLLLCGACGHYAPEARFRARDPQARARHAGGYKGIAWGHAEPLTAAERKALRAVYAEAARRCG